VSGFQDRTGEVGANCGGIDSTVKKFGKSADWILMGQVVGILIRSREKGLLEGPDALAKLGLLAKHGRYKNSIIEDARLKLEARPCARR
jgi:hypothetical protein